MSVLKGEAIDIAGGPTHDVMVWRQFVKLSRSVDEAGPGWKDSPLTESVREIANISVQTKTLLNALMQSCRNGLTLVELDQ